MRHVIQLRPGSGFVRRTGRRRRGRCSRKRFIIATLLVIGVQLVTAGCYTMSGHPFNTRNRKETSISQEGGGLGLLFSMKDYDATIGRKALRKVGNRTCFVEGLDELNGARATAGGCPCKDDWYGTSCSIPGFINRSPTGWSKDSLRVRDRPRRIIHAFPFNMEFEMLEIRFAELAEVVDVFLILESNYTAYGTPKPLHLLDRIRNGTIQNLQPEKVAHVFLDYFPQKAYSNGWVTDALHRNYLGTHGLRRLGGLRTDDLLVLTDADELPRRQLLSFLKWHDGYSQPVIFNYRWSVYGLYWGVPSHDGVIRTQRTRAVVTVVMAVYVFRYQLYSIRDAQRFLHQHAFRVQVTVTVVVVVHSSSSSTATSAKSDVIIGNLPLTYPCCHGNKRCIALNVMFVTIMC